ncbi:MAG TPA: hypothetical protein VN700_17410 [Vicinamibacterales bacterium]|nr:hypothetical protein [Vicinamibacterales bacterium]
MRLEEFTFPDITDTEVLAEPLYGCWEGNLTHAIQRDPVDICRLRRESRIVLGNSGIVRVLRRGRSVHRLNEGDVCALVPIGATDPYGYLTRVLAYDAPGTMGVLAKQLKLDERQLEPVPANSDAELRQWAAFSLRYPTAWANWRVAFGAWRLQMPEAVAPHATVLAWGGGVALAELTLAQAFGCKAIMVASSDERRRLIESLGIAALDRRAFGGLDYDEVRCTTDREFRKRYQAAESAFLGFVREATANEMASIVIDNIGKPVLRASLKALARQGVLTTVGWKCGADMNVVRAVECQRRHVHVFTHGASYEEGLASFRWALEHQWMPPVSDEVYDWHDVPQLADDFRDGRVRSYFPLFRVNAA